MGSRRSDGLEAALASELPPERAGVTACVQIGYKGRFVFFRPATEPRNHAVSFRPFHSGQVLCIRFGHRARCRGLSGHRAPPLPDAHPDQTRLRHQTYLAWVAGPPAGPIPCCAAGDILCGRVQSAPGGGIRRRWGQDSGPRTREMPLAVRKSPRPRRMSPSVAGHGRHAHAGQPARQLGPARKGRHPARLRG